MTSKSAKRSRTGAAALAALFVVLSSGAGSGGRGDRLDGRAFDLLRGLQDAAHEFTRLTKIKVTAIPGGCGAASAGVKQGKVDVGGLVAPSRKRSSPSPASSTTPLESRVLPSTSTRATLSGRSLNSR